MTSLRNPWAEALQERLEVFKKYTVEHAMLIRKDDELTQRIWEPGGFAFLLLCGPTGIGKSELLRVVTHRMQTRPQVVIPGDRLPLPVIFVETPAPFTLREWYERVLRALDEPFIEEVTYREVGTSPNGKKATSGRGRASTKHLDEAPEWRWPVEKALANRAKERGDSGEEEAAVRERARKVPAEMRSVARTPHSLAVV
jgi:AAA domain